MWETLEITIGRDIKFHKTFYLHVENKVQIIEGKIWNNRLNPQIMSPRNFSRFPQVSLAFCTLHTLQCKCHFAHGGTPGAEGRWKEGSGSSWSSADWWHSEGRCTLECACREGEINNEGQWTEHWIAFLPGWIGNKALWFYTQILQVDIPRGVWKSVTALNSCSTKKTVKDFKLLLCFVLRKTDRFGY